MVFRESWKTLKSPHVIQLFDYKITRTSTIDIIQFIDGSSLMEIIKAKPNKFKNPEFTWKVFEGIVLGTKALHDINYIHSDLKPENVIIDKEDNAVVIDYDSAVINGSEQFTPFTPQFSDFQKALQDSYLNNEKSDVYSLGMILVNMVAPSILEEMGNSLFEIYGFQDAGNFKFPRGTLKSAVWLISQCIVNSQESRISMDSLLGHIRQLKQKNNNELLTGEFTLNHMQILNEQLKVIKIIPKEDKEEFIDDENEEDENEEDEWYQDYLQPKITTPLPQAESNNIQSSKIISKNKILAPAQNSIPGNIAHHRKNNQKTSDSFVKEIKSLNKKNREVQIKI